MPVFKLNECQYPTRSETELLRAAGLVATAMPGTNEPILINGSWNSADTDNLFRILFPRPCEYLDLVSDLEESSIATMTSHIGLCIRDKRKLLLMQVDSATGADLIRARSSAQGRSNAFSNIHLGMSRLASPIH